MSNIEKHRIWKPRSLNLFIIGVYLYIIYLFVYFDLLEKQMVY